LKTSEVSGKRKTSEVLNQLWKPGVFENLGGLREKKDLRGFESAFGNPEFLETSEVF